MTERPLACWLIAALSSMPVHAGWVKGQGGQIPPNMIVAGQNRNGQPLYVCRAQYGGGVYPGTLGESSRDCSVPYEGRAYSLSDYEVLVDGGYSWVSVYNGEIPFDALPAGNEQQGGTRTLYICRGEVNSEWRPGKIREADGGCRIPYEGRELTALWYQVLVRN
jgi:hypothetical protein